jgi:hypothetical protein
MDVGLTRSARPPSLSQHGIYQVTRQLQDGLRRNSIACKRQAWIVLVSSLFNRIWEPPRHTPSTVVTLGQTKTFTWDLCVKVEFGYTCQGRRDSQGWLPEITRRHPLTEFMEHKLCRACCGETHRSRAEPEQLQSPTFFHQGETRELYIAPAIENCQY